MLSAVGVLGAVITVAMPFAVLGAVEAAGVAATQIALGVSVEAVAGASAGAILGVGMIGTTAAVVDNSPPQQRKTLSSNVLLNNEDYISTSQRPISGWRTWASEQIPTEQPTPGSRNNWTSGKIMALQ